MVLTEAPIIGDKQRTQQARSEEVSRKRQNALLAMPDSPRQINQASIHEALAVLTPLKPGTKGEILRSTDDLDALSKMTPRQAEMTLRVLGTQSSDMQDILVNGTGKTTIVFERSAPQGHAE